MPKRPDPEPYEGLTADEIVAIVRDVRAIAGRQRDRAREAEKRYPEFKERYPFLFDMVCADTFDERRFQYMIQMKARVDAAQMTQEQASKRIGQDLYNVYVKDRVHDGGPGGASS